MRQGGEVPRVPADAGGAAEAAAVIVAEDRRRGEAEGVQRLLHEPALDLVDRGCALHRLAHRLERVLGAAEAEVEQLLDGLGGEFVQPRQQVDEARGDQEPRPFGHVDIFVDHLDPLVQEQGRHAQQQSQNGGAAER